MPVGAARDAAKWATANCTVHPKELCSLHVWALFDIVAADLLLDHNRLSSFVEADRRQRLLGNRRSVEC
jgi:hypothetical protein